MILHSRLEDGILVVTFDDAAAPLNTLTRKAREEFVVLLDRLEHDPMIRAAVLVSGKPDSFIAGADIEELVAFRSADEAERLSRDGHRMLERIEKGRIPVVAAIHGACLGGGLEVALACRYRIATDHAKTVLALPEVQLGILPGGGGTQRLPKLVGLQGALDMMLTGKNVRARKAYAMGLVDEVVHPSILRRIALQRAGELVEGTRAGVAPKRKSRGVAGALLEENPIGRAVVFKKAREEVAKKTRGLYPAPLAILDVVAASYAGKNGYAEEARQFGRLTQTPESRELAFLFFATTSLKKDPVVEGPVPDAPVVRRLGVLGTGFMGAGIAAVSAMQGYEVRFKDTAHERVLAGMKAVHGVLSERYRRKQITKPQLEDQVALVSGTTEYSGFGNVDLVIEAVFEDLEVKRSVVREVEPRIPGHAILASNTSTIPIRRIAEAAERPERVLGLHFFSPVHRMPLLEIIVTERTSREAIAASLAYGRKIGKTCIVVNDAPGFYANRILSPYVNEAGRLLDEGAGIDAIDGAMVAWGYPVGPITLIDEVGLDIAGKSGKIMLEAFGQRLNPSESLQRVLAAGRLGRKGKQGFYLYDEKGRKAGVDASVYELIPHGAERRIVDRAEIQERCAFAMVNEALRALEEGILRSPRDGDVGAVFGIGFPPFRGGPFRFVDAFGARQLVERLEALDGRFPGRFTPADLLVQMARKGERFYPEHGRPVA